MKIVKVRQMTSPNSGRPVANQFIITTPEGEYFQSYESVIAFRPYGKDNPFGSEKVILDSTYWCWSTTTGKYRNQFLGEGIKETTKKIDEGVYILANLN